MPQTPKSLAKMALAITLTALLSFWILQQLDWRQLQSLFTNLRWPYLFLGLLFYCSVYLHRNLRFLLLLPRWEIPFFSFLPLTAVHNLYVRLLPNPAGEMAFIYLAKKHFQIPLSQSLSTLFFYRLFDFIAIIIIFLLNWLLHRHTFTSLPRGPQTVFLALALLAFLFLLLFFLPFFLQQFNRAAQRWLFLAPLQKPLQKLQQSLTLLQKKKLYLQTLFLSFSLWLNMYGAYYFFLRSLQLKINLPFLVFGATTQNLANALPNLGGWGVMEAGWLVGLKLSGLTTQQALLAAVGVDLLTFAGTLLWGSGGGLILFLKKNLVSKSNGSDNS